MDTSTSSFFSDAEIIHRYTREEAIEDGVLVDVSKQARETGFKFPVALTRAAWASAVAWTRKEGWQDERGRLHDVLWMLYCGIKRSQGGERVDFTVLVVPDEGRELRPQPVKLKALCGPGDEGEPVITVLLPRED